jgi:selenocysteine lyase/cysteine desulfurase
MLVNTRRSFIKHTATLLGSLALHQEAKAAFSFDKDLLINSLGEDAVIDWGYIRQLFTINPLMINLNNAGLSPCPTATLDALNHYNRMCNDAPSHTMWRILDANREPLREKLAELAGVSTKEIAITRNATESLNSIVFGLNLKAGDEVVLSYYDYPHMKTAWEQREKRDGIKLVWVDFEMPSEDADYLTNAYTSKFTKKTKLVHITHLVNWTGQIMPVRRIADKAKEMGIEVLVDAAQTFGLLDYKIPDLNCDYWGTSLHKWLHGPVGTGLTYIRKDKIANVWSLLSDSRPENDNILKMENLGSRSFPIEMATGYSIDLQHFIGTKRKQERLHYLKNYWMEQIKDEKSVKFFTSLQPEWGCAIGVIGIEGKKGTEIVDYLMREHRIHTTNMDIKSVNGVRVSPSIYTSEADLDKLIKALKKWI